MSNRKKWNRNQIIETFNEKHKRYNFMQDLNNFYLNYPRTLPAISNQFYESMLTQQKIILKDNSKHSKAHRQTTQNDTGKENHTPEANCTPAKPSLSQPQSVSTNHTSNNSNNQQLSNPTQSTLQEAKGALNSLNPLKAMNPHYDSKMNPTEPTYVKPQWGETMANKKVCMDHMTEALKIDMEEFMKIKKDVENNVGIWYYIDSYDRMQGPFRTDQVFTWRKTNHLHGNVYFSYMDRTYYYPLDILWKVTGLDKLYKIVVTKDLPHSNHAINFKVDSLTNPNTLDSLNFDNQHFLQMNEIHHQSQPSKHIQYSNPVNSKDKTPESTSLDYNSEYYLDHQHEQQQYSHEVYGNLYEANKMQNIPLHPAETAHANFNAKAKLNPQFNLSPDAQPLPYDPYLYSHYQRPEDYTNMVYNNYVPYGYPAEQQPFTNVNLKHDMNYPDSTANEHMMKGYQRQVMRENVVPSNNIHQFDAQNKKQSINSQLYTEIINKNKNVFDTSSYEYDITDSNIERLLEDDN